MNFSVKNVKEWLKKTNNLIQENKNYLTKLDQAIGDGDHGINMARGFDAAVNVTDDKQYDTVADILKDIAMTVMSKVGGASGPLYGTAFLRLSLSLKGKTEVGYADLTKALEDGLNGMKQRGRSDAGEKTLVDVWEPVVTFMKQKDAADADGLMEIAKSAVEKTKDIMATKGRGAYFKEKSVGNIDPGAMSSFYLFSALAEVLKGGGE